MINQELIDYIKNQIKLDRSENIIKSMLKNAGWQEADIEEGFKAVLGSNTSTPTPPLFSSNQSLPPTSKRDFRKSYFFIITFAAIGLLVSGGVFAYFYYFQLPKPETIEGTTIISTSTPATTLKLEKVFDKTFDESISKFIVGENGMPKVLVMKNETRDIKLAFLDNKSEIVKNIAIGEKESIVNFNEKTNQIIKKKYPSKCVLNEKVGNICEGNMTFEIIDLEGNIVSAFAGPYHKKFEVNYANYIFPSQFQEKYIEVISGEGLTAGSYYLVDRISKSRKSLFELNSTTVYGITSVLLSDDGFLIAISYTGSSGGSEKSQLFLFDDQGNKQWQKNIDGSLNLYQGSFSPNNNFLYASAYPEGRLFTIDGAEIELKDDFPCLNGVLWNSSETKLICGYHQGNNYNNLLMLNVPGKETVWQEDAGKTLGIQESQIFSSALSNDGQYLGVIILKKEDDFNSSFKDPHLLIYNSDGKLLAKTQIQEGLFDVSAIFGSINLVIRNNFINITIGNRLLQYSLKR